MKIRFSTTGHTDTDVPVFAFGPGAKLFEGTFDNTEIAKKIADLWKLRKLMKLPKENESSKILDLDKNHL